MNTHEFQGYAWRCMDVHGYPWISTSIYELRQNNVFHFRFYSCFWPTFSYLSGSFWDANVLQISGREGYLVPRRHPHGPNRGPRGRRPHHHHTTPHHTTPHHGNQRRMNGSPKRKHSRNKPRTPHYATPHQTTRQSQLHAATQKTHTHSTKRKL